MKAAVLTGQGIEIRERETPKCGPGEILIQTIACGICEGDVHRYRAAIGKPGFGEYCSVVSSVVWCRARRMLPFRWSPRSTRAGRAWERWLALSPPGPCGQYHVFRSRWR